MVPITSLVFLWGYVINSDSSDLTSALQNVLNEYVKEGGQSYERFHAYWEILWRTIEKKQPPRYLDYHIKSIKESTALRELVELKHQINEKNLKYLVIQDNQKSVFERVFLAVDNQPGFDILIFQESEQGTFTIALETRFSKPSSDTYQSADEICKKHVTTYQIFSKYFGDSNSSIQISFFLKPII